MPAILLVEDEPLIRMMVADMATELGHTVAVEAGDLKHAQEFAANTSFDLAILDLQLPDGSSRPIAELLAARNIPFAFAIGDGPDCVPERFGDRPILRKPFEAEELRTCIDGLLSTPKLD